jgi:hypothetical protein
MNEVRRCSAESVARREPMLGTASTVRNWLLIEHDGPWGADPLQDGRLPGGVGEHLRRESTAHDVRILMIRRVDRRSNGSTTCFAIHSGPDEPWIERIELARFENAAAIDLERLGQGRRLGRGELHVGAIFLVCTHGRRDPCCAERGRPLADAMAAVFPGQTWEASHIGGDRFAGNLLAFPHGAYFGRVEPMDGPAVARAYLEGRLDLAHLRGRSCWPMRVQAAEHFLREQKGLDRIDDVEVRNAAPVPGGFAARFRTIAGRFEVRIAREPSAEAVRLTCHSRADEQAPVYRLLSIEAR